MSSNVISSSTTRLRPASMGIAWGVTFSLITLILATMSVALGWETRTFQYLKSFLDFQTTVKGFFIAFMMAFIDGYVMGFISAFIYNWLEQWRQG